MYQEAIEQAVNHYRELLLSQGERAERLNNQAPLEKKDKTGIGVVGGDGIGPIICKESERMLRFLLKDEVESGKVVFKENKSTQR